MNGNVFDPLASTWGSQLWVVFTFVFFSWGLVHLAEFIGAGVAVSE